MWRGFAPGFVNYKKGALDSQVIQFTRCLPMVGGTDTRFIQKIYAHSSLLQGKHLPFSPSPLRLNIFPLFVILSLTQLYRYTPEIFLFSTATFKYTYRVPPQTYWTRIVSKRGLVKISVIETNTATSGLRWIFHMHSEFSRPAMCNNDHLLSNVK
jgi:hypothetical protein